MSQKCPIGPLCTAMYERVNQRHGYSVAYKAWCAADDALRPLLAHVLALRPTTLRGAALRPAFLFEVIQNEEMEIVFYDDSRETVLPALVADMRRLADIERLAGGVA